jgi:hypothetical protein
MGRSLTGLGLSPEEYAAIRAMGSTKKPRGFGPKRPKKKAKARFHVGDRVMAIFSLRHVGIPVLSGEPMTVVAASGSRYFVRGQGGEGWVSDEVLEKMP